MMTRILFAVLVTILSIQVQAQSWVTNGLVAYYPFNGTANDGSGNGHNGVINGGSISATTNHLGVAGSALHFGGASYVSITPTPINLNTNWTISFWAIVDPNAGVHNFLSTGNDNLDALNTRYVYGDANPWQFAVGPKFGYGCVWNGTNTPRVWNMITLVRNGNLVQGYFNNTRVTSTNINFTIQDAGSLWIGRMEGGAFYDLFGAMSDVSLYNRAFSSNDVRQLFDYQTAQPCNARQATATAVVSGGAVVAANLTDTGCGYLTTPQVLIEGGGGSGANAVATINNGVVIGITITSGGSGYTNAPNVYIDSPAGPHVALLKAVQPAFTQLFFGTTYQLQMSGDMLSWTNQGAPFVATNSVMTYPQYWNVDNWNKLYFRLQPLP